MTLSSNSIDFVQLVLLKAFEESYPGLKNRIPPSLSENFRGKPSLSRENRYFERLYDHWIVPLIKSLISTKICIEFVIPGIADGWF